jgi:predicted aldo/keto reductase-like oxidoreductase
MKTTLDKQALRQQENASFQKVLLKFVAGGTSATIISVGMNSVDHIKTRLQIQQKAPVIATQFTPYSSFSNAYSRVLREEGFLIVCVMVFVTLY